MQAEALKHAFAVRSHLGDPGTPDAPFANVTAVMASILDPAFADELRWVGWVVSLGV